MPNYIRADVFPAQVDYNGETYRPSRAIVTDDSVHVYVDSSDGPIEAVGGLIHDFTGDMRTGFTVTLGDGSVLMIYKTSGCGCGSRLRGYRPFPGVSRSAVR